jgi:hypothetical protein
VNESAFENWARRLVAPLAGVFFVFMFLGWHAASVHVASIVNVRTTTSAWHGWGALAGLAAAGLLLWTWMVAIRAEITRRFSDRLVTAALGSTVLVFTIVELVTGTASVTVASTVVVTTTQRWPAYVALAVAAALAFVAVVPLARPSRYHGGRVGLGAR